MWGWIFKKKIDFKPYLSAILVVNLSIMGSLRVFPAAMGSIVLVFIAAVSATFAIGSIVQFWVFPVN